MSEYHLPVKEIGKFGGVLAITLGSQQLFHALTGPESAGVVAGSVALSLGIGTELAKKFFSIVGDLLGSEVKASFDKVYRSIRKFDNGELTRAIITAYERSFNRIEKEFFQSVDLKMSLGEKVQEKLSADISDKSFAIKRIHQFFDEVTQLLVSEEAINKLLKENGQVSHAGLFPLVIESVPGVWDSPLIQEHDFRQFIKDRLYEYFNHYLLSELKASEQTKTAYFKHLLETTLLHTQRNTAQLEILNATAARTNNSVTLIIDELKTLASTQKVLLARLGDLERYFQSRLNRVERQLAWISDFLKNGGVARPLEVTRRTEVQLIEVKWIPLLTLNTIEIKDTRYNFNYKSRFTTFVGRSSTLNRLYDFLTDDREFCWWLMTGSGGMGKSRIAMELCLQALQDGYAAGFYKQELVAQKNWAEFRAPFPTLIVIDYALANQTDTENILSTLTALKAKKLLLNKVRVLLIDRNVDDLWAQKQRGMELASCAYLPDQSVLDLAKDQDDIRWDIISQVTGELPEKDNELNKESILAKLSKIDPQKTPLFAFFAGELIAQTGNIDHWQAASLLDMLVDRLEREVWSKYPAFAADPIRFKELLLFHTLVRKISRETATEAALQQFGFTSQQTLTYFSLVGKEDDHAYLYGLQPDILGEYFIFWQYRYFRQIGMTRRFLEIYRQAWEFAPADTVQTMDLLFKDFLADSEGVNNDLAEFKALLLSPETYNELSKPALSNVALLFTNALSYLVKANFQETAPLSRYLEELNQKFPEDENIAVMLALAILNRSRFLPKDAEEELKTNFHFVLALYKQHPTNRDCAYCVLELINVSLTTYRHEGRDTAARNWLPAWNEIVAKFGDDEDIVRVSAYFLLDISAYGTDPEWLELKLQAAKLYEGLLSSSFANAGVCKNFVYFFSNFIGRPVTSIDAFNTTCSRLLEKVQAIDKQYPDDPAINKALSHAYRQLLYLYAQGDHELEINHLAVFNDAIELFNRSAQTKELSDDICEATASIIYYNYKNEVNLDSSTALLPQIFHLFERDNSLSKAICFARSTQDILAHFEREKATITEETEQFFQQTLATVVQQFPDQVDLLEFANGAAGTLEFLISKRDRAANPRVLDLLNFQLQTYQSYPDNETLAWYLANSISNFIHYVEVEGVLENDAVFIPMLKELAKSFPLNTQVRACICSAVSYRFWRAELNTHTSPETAREYLGTLKPLIEAGPPDAYFTATLLDILMNLIAIEAITYPDLQQLMTDFTFVIPVCEELSREDEAMQAKLLRYRQWVLFRKKASAMVTDEEVLDALAEAQEHYRSAPDNEEFAEHYLFCGYFAAANLAIKNQAYFRLVKAHHKVFLKIFRTHPDNLRFIEKFSGFLGKMVLACHDLKTDLRYARRCVRRIISISAEKSNVNIIKQRIIAEYNLSLFLMYQFHQWGLKTKNAWIIIGYAYAFVLLNYAKLKRYYTDFRDNHSTYEDLYGEFLSIKYIFINIERIKDIASARVLAAEVLEAIQTEELPADFPQLINFVPILQEIIATIDDLD